MGAINVNYMTKTYNSFLKNQTVKTSSEKSVADIISDKHAEAEKTEDVAALKTESISITDMTMDEYKAYISDKISQMPMNPSRMQDSISINISEDGFEAMKNDPEYENWVLDYIQRDFMCYDPWTSVCGGSYVVYNFGASKEEFHAEGWYAGYQNGNGENLYNKKSQNSFWERRVENKKRIEKQMKKREEQKQIREKMEKQAAYEEYVLQKMIQAADEASANPNIDLGTKAAVGSPQAVSSYEACFMVIEDI